MARMYPRPVLGRGGAIVPVGSPGHAAPPTAATKGFSWALPKLDALLNFVPFGASLANPLTAKLALGAGLAYGGYQLFNPENAVDAVLSRAQKPGGGFKKGEIAKLLDVIDGDENYFGLDDASLQQEKDERTYRFLTKDNKTTKQRIQQTGLLPRMGEDEVSFMERTRRPAEIKANTEAANDLMSSPLYQQMVMRDARDARNAFRLEQRALDNQAMQIQGGIDTTTLQIQTAADANKERMYYYNQDLQAKRENDRYRTTAGLIQGLGALGAAFVL